jgi:hypothetical protein
VYVHTIRRRRRRRRCKRVGENTRVKSLTTSFLSAADQTSLPRPLRTPARDRLLRRTTLHNVMLHARLSLRRVRYYYLSRHYEISSIAAAATATVVVVVVRVYIYAPISLLLLLQVRGITIIIIIITYSNIWNVPNAHRRVL